MSRSSNPWDEPDPEHRGTGLPTDPEATTSSTDVMASIDSSAARPELVIADLSRENAWLSVDEADATVLEEWC